MKEQEQYLTNELTLTTENLLKTLVESINLAQQIIDTDESIGMIEFTGLTILLTRRPRTKLKKNVLEVEKGLFRLKIILREINRKQDNFIELAKYIKSHPEGSFISNLEKWKTKSTKMVLYEFVKLHEIIKRIKIKNTAHNNM